MANYRPAISNRFDDRATQNNIYSITGKFKGKPIAKTVKSSGCTWYQNIVYNAGILFKDKKTVKYECFRPDNIKLYTMVAETQGIEQLNGMNANKIAISLTGFLSAFWSCSYYFDPATLNFVDYKGGLIHSFHMSNAYQRKKEKILKVEFVGIIC